MSEKKLTEQEVIEIRLTKGQKGLLYPDLKQGIRKIPKKQRLPQYKFLVSVLKKLKDRNDEPMLFHARECATMVGWLSAHIQMLGSVAGKFIEIKEIIEFALNKWKEENPE